jgi:hypothetical protein
VELFAPSPKKRLYRTSCRYLAPHLRAHVTRLRFNANPPQIKAVRIPARTDGWIVAQPAVSVPFAGVIKQLEMFVTELEQPAPQTRSIGRPARAMTLVRAIVLPPGIMEHREQSHHLFDRVTARSDKQAIALDSAPMRRPVHRITITLKRASDMFPNVFPVKAHGNKMIKRLMAKCKLRSRVSAASANPVAQQNGVSKSLTLLKSETSNLGFLLPS